MKLQYKIYAVKQSPPRAVQNDGYPSSIYFSTDNDIVLVPFGDDVLYNSIEEAFETISAEGFDHFGNTLTILPIIITHTKK
jgi:hypothetical protein